MCSDHSQWAETGVREEWPVTTSMDTDTEPGTGPPGGRMNLNMLGKYKADIAKKVVSLKEDSKGKTEMVMAYIKEDSPLKNGM